MDDFKDEFEFPDEKEAKKAAGLAGASTMTGLLNTEKPYRVDLTGMANPD